MRAGSVLDRFQNKRTNDIEAGDFDEAELDELHLTGLDRDQYAVGDVSDEEDHVSPHSGSQQPTVANDHREPS